MFELFYMGGPLFMGILSILLLIVIVITVVFLVKVLNRQVESTANFRQQIKYIRAVGLFALVTGILGQLVGLYAAFIAIEAAADISPAILAGGLKVSMITTIYGILIYLFSILLWFIVSLIYDRSRADL
ncbi:MAG: MotA/TolQ/ExbB proton channel family protein [Bacteroidales bacterium]